MMMMMRKRRPIVHYYTYFIYGTRTRRHTHTHTRNPHHILVFDIPHEHRTTHTFIAADFSLRLANLRAACATQHPKSQLHARANDAPPKLYQRVRLARAYVCVYVCLCVRDHKESYVSCSTPGPGEHFGMGCTAKGMILHAQPSPFRVAPSTSNYPRMRVNTHAPAPKDGPPSPPPPSCLSSVCRHQQLFSACLRECVRTVGPCPADFVLDYAMCSDVHVMSVSA